MEVRNTEHSAEIYSQMRKRKTFETTVDADEFGRIQEALAESQRMRILICEDKGVPVAGLGCLGNGRFRDLLAGCH